MYKRQIALCAIPLQQPEQKPLLLEAEKSGFTLTGKWAVNLTRMDPGAWMIVPRDEDVNIRPMLWIKKSDSLLVESQATTSTLQQATRIQSKDERELAIRGVLNEMATDFQHKSWDYLSKLWAATGHLPLHAFDAWVFAVSEPAFLAALAAVSYTHLTLPTKRIV